MSRSSDPVIISYSINSSTGAIGVPIEKHGVMPV
jgi:hypothetical protein